MAGVGEAAAGAAIVAPAAPGEAFQQRLLRVPTPLRSRWGPGHGAAQRRRLEVFAEPLRRTAVEFDPEEIRSIIGLLQEQSSQVPRGGLFGAAPAA
mmetsp:Transcript_56436/g.177251  ORF Transcript_56436/g.177251 Transcript_56436/m.177251 type:complete len:96 (+) Transcript_56436:47-334(+)